MAMVAKRTRTSARLCSYCGLVKTKFFHKRRKLLSGRLKVGRQNCCTDCARDRQFFRHCIVLGVAAIAKRIDREEEKLRIMKYFMRNSADTETALLLKYRQAQRRAADV